MAGSSQYRFSVLAKIVKHMKIRHQDGDDHPLTLDDILDETNQLDIGSSVKNVINILLSFLFSLFTIFLIDLCNFGLLTVAANRSIAKQSKN